MLTIAHNPGIEEYFRLDINKHSNLLYLPRFVLSAPEPSFKPFSTSLLASAMACAGTWRLKKPVSPLIGLWEKFRCRKYFVRFIFVASCDYEKLLTTKIFRITVYTLVLCNEWSVSTPTWSLFQHLAIAQHQYWNTWHAVLDYSMHEVDH